MITCMPSSLAVYAYEKVQNPHMGMAVKQFWLIAGSLLAAALRRCRLACNHQAMLHKLSMLHLSPGCLRPLAPPWLLALGCTSSLGSCSWLAKTWDSKS
ncbi:hypothetical protein HaLaN_03733 [Haematococcus lacustris]|uniref:Uncharacterized protein n=1 Tax=Haematococcus lacustris TaxID=44745 RepID=A0A699YH06_HAELA|nr:hypothetical protein HaLaN_03733 [Haematococcus lacustris]